MTTKTAENGKVREGRSTREAILKAASRLIHVHGYNHTSLDDVLRESGVGKGNFYYYFKSKEDLGYAILDQVIGSFLERTRSSPASPTPRGKRSRRSVASSIASSRCSALATASGAAR